MDETEMRQRLDDMADARRDALHTRARRDATMALLERDGQVTHDGLETYLRQVHQPPSRRELADQVARKAAAAIEHADRAADAAVAEAQSARTARDKVAAHLADCDQAVADADQAATAAEQAREDARELAEFAARYGDPGDAPEPTHSSLNAEPAQAGSGSEGATL